jgi:Outer membrane protein beta-barrel domain
MHHSNAWHLLPLRRLQKVASASAIASKQIKLLAFALLFLPTLMWGQAAGRGNYNFLDFQSRPYYFGITLGYNQSDYRVFRGKGFILNDSVAGVESLRGPGFNLQIVSNLKLGDNFDLRFLPGFSFAERNLLYDPTRKNKPNYPNNVSSVFVELPFHVRYKSAPYNDKRLFVIAGIKYSYDIQAKSRTRQIGNSVRVSPTDFQAEFGVGMQMFFPFFIFSPEIKMSQGLGNVLIYRSDLRESTVLEKLISRTFTISLHFEG